jgi:hypothetical protein
MEMVGFCERILTKNASQHEKSLRQFDQGFRSTKAPLIGSDSSTPAAACRFGKKKPAALCAAGFGGLQI